MRLLVLLLAGSLLIAGCSDGDGAEHRAGTPAAAGEAPAAPAAERSIELESCQGAWIPERRSFSAGWRRRSTRIGPLLLGDASGLAKSDLAGRNVRKIRALIRPVRALTIEIGAIARSRIGFVKDPRTRWSGSAADLYPVLRIENCPRLPPEIGTLYAGQRYGLGLFVGVRKNGCVPIIVTGDGGRRHRRVISFGAGDCA